ncbi:MAG: polyphenol oxidase family protein [Candidatus Paceibacterota bacterium]
MEEGTSFDFPGLHVDLTLPGTEVAEKSVVIPTLPHGANIVSVQTGLEDLGDCDALITRDKTKMLGIKTADCAPVCFADGNTVGIAHVGWRGLCLGLVEKTAGHFSAESLVVYVAPFLNDFEIKKDDCYEQIAQKFGGQFFDEREGRVMFNFKDAIASLLPPQTVFDVRTTENLSFPSYRRDKTIERFYTTVSFPAV